MCKYLNRVSNVIVVAQLTASYTQGPGTTPVAGCSRRMPSVKGTSDLGRVIKFNVVCSLYSAWVHHHGAGARVL